ncbi:TPA: ABC transporter ATP-binding protein [Candidatus Berkelbacteria bacterium]|uniref:ABC transporter ATP-binding protein, putative ABC transport system ATP-binding protein n=1 Tax=Berkelbacteria bacterium GW2011_GWE1_39_12 TaxID=1618337 RepID=A0A0G4B4M8_9BACT|nr:MAG: ABC transporter ATP-binding protein, putative ABC transport system ATP-binding protein [Berkelbacteria bacterium GW2011_GWE1_39_12]HBO60948.1 ABC transporter ATP-binding protein [Candidatus Berkelbacteria bacterium]
MKNIIIGKNLKKCYKMSKTNTVNALNGVDVEIQEGDFTAIVGPSGCGKSTLLHILGLLDRPDSGELSIDEIDVSKMKERQAYKLRAKKIGFVFQGFNLIPTLTALENIMLAGQYGGLKPKARKEKALALLEKMGLKDRANHKPNELSGGQQQRIALARALVNDPSLILADEPTGELDSKTSLEIIEMLKKLNKEENRTFIIVTHNNEVAEACKKTIRLRDGKNDN